MPLFPPRRGETLYMVPQGIRPVVQLTAIEVLNNFTVVESFYHNANPLSDWFIWLCALRSWPGVWETWRPTNWLQYPLPVWSSNVVVKLFKLLWSRISERTPTSLDRCYNSKWYCFYSCITSKSTFSTIWHNDTFCSRLAPSERGHVHSSDCAESSWPSTIWQKTCGGSVHHWLFRGVPLWPISRQQWGHVCQRYSSPFVFIHAQLHVHILTINSFCSGDDSCCPGRHCHQHWGHTCCENRGK